MALHLVNLNDGDTRQLMRSEASDDLASDAGVNRSKYFTDNGFEAYKSGLLLEAIDHHDDEWLASALDKPGYFATHHPRKTKNGTSMVKVPITAPTTFAEGEFNRYYIRAVCLRAINEGRAIEVVRAKSVANPRAESEQLIGTSLEPAVVLTDVRENPGADLVQGVPSGPNSGLSIHLL